MRITTRTRYGFRFMANLALHHQEKGVRSLKEISKDEEISLKYLEQIVPLLKISGLINVERGAKGGYSLSKAPKDILLIDILEALEGKIVLVECTQDASSCGRSSRCTMHDFWDNLKSYLRNYFSQHTLEDLINKKIKL